MSLLNDRRSASFGCAPRLNATDRRPATKDIRFDIRYNGLMGALPRRQARHANTSGDSCCCAP
jgi:hypothetical protein